MGGAQILVLQKLVRTPYMNGHEWDALQVSAEKRIAGCTDRRARAQIFMHKIIIDLVQRLSVHRMVGGHPRRYIDHPDIEVADCNHLRPVQKVDSYIGVVDVADRKS